LSEINESQYIANKIKRVRNVIAKAGIIPVISPPTDFNLDWDDTLIPIAPDYYAIEQAVLECAYAGCKTIWIVANNDTTPLIRHRIGDYVQDPVYLRRMAQKYPSLQRKEISVFYVPMPPQHDNKELCTAWTILYGAKTAYEVGLQISKWATPKRFYVAFPLSVYPADTIRPHREEIRDIDNLIYTYEDKSILTGDLLGFTFTDKQMRQGLELFMDVETSLIFEEPEEEKKHFFDNFSLEKIFKQIILKKRVEVELSWYYPIDGWDKYCSYMASEERKEIKHPGKLVISYREYSPIGKDVEKTLDEED
jgi:hypothetical protein